MYIIGNMYIVLHPTWRIIHQTFTSWKHKFSKPRPRPWTPLVPLKVKKVKADIALPGGPHVRATGRHLPYGITQCYLSPETSERAPPNPSHAGWYSVYLPRRDGRLGWPSWLDRPSAPAGSRTSDLSITSPTLNHQGRSYLRAPTFRYRVTPVGQMLLSSS